MNRRQAAFGALALSLLIANCGGRAATDSAAGGSSGNGSKPGGQFPIGGGTGPVGPEPSSPADAGPDLPGPIGPAQGCTDELIVVAAIWDNPCPDSLCLATSRAAVTCSDPTSGVTDASIAQCGTLWVVSLTQSTQHGKTCYYSDSEDVGSSSPLVGAAAWDSNPSYCKHSSSRISAGLVPNTCQVVATASLCSLGQGTSLGTGGAGGASDASGAGGDPTIPNEGVTTCHNNFSGMCEPCCPATPPDCSTKPDGYPGYSCTEGSTASPSSFCSCRCWSGVWSCGC